MLFCFSHSPQIVVSDVHNCACMYDDMPPMCMGIIACILVQASTEHEGNNSTVHSRQVVRLGKVLCRPQQRHRAAELFWRLLYDSPASAATEQQSSSRLQHAPSSGQPVQQPDEPGRPSTQAISASIRSDVDVAALLNTVSSEANTNGSRAPALAPRPTYTSPPSSINSEAAREAVKLCNSFDLTTNELGGADRIQQYFMEPLLQNSPSRSGVPCTLYLGLHGYRSNSQLPCHSQQADDGLCVAVYIQKICMVAGTSYEHGAVHGRSSQQVNDG